MTDLLGLVKNTGAYKTVRGDKLSGRLSHAYLILTQDEQNLTEYLKVFARLILCQGEHPCGQCRLCKLIDGNVYSDVILYPQNSASVTSDEVNALIGECYVKPLESDKKVFLISHAQTMNVAAQNKLLKTLEEPPKNVHLIIGATSEFPLLPTVKSRVKKLEIPPYAPEKLFDALKRDYPDEQKLLAAIACGDGTVGRACLNYDDEELKTVTELCEQVIVDMSSSSEVLTYSNKIAQSKCDFSKFLSVLELLLRDLLVYFEGEKSLTSNSVAFEKIKNAKNFTSGSIIYAIESVTEAAKRKKFNANATMLTEWLLFRILEGKYKWQKL